LSTTLSFNSLSSSSTSTFKWKWKIRNEYGRISTSQIVQNWKSLFSNTWNG